MQGQGCKNLPPLENSTHQARPPTLTDDFDSAKGWVHPIVVGREAGARGWVSNFSLEHVGDVIAFVCWEVSRQVGETLALLPRRRYDAEGRRRGRAGRGCRDRGRGMGEEGGQQEGGWAGR